MDDPNPHAAPRPEAAPISERPVHVSFAAHVELLQLFLAHREEIVERIQGLLNAQRQPVQYLRDAAVLSRRLEDCFFATALTRDQSRLRGRLEEAHRASGFRPRKSPGMHNDLVDPTEMMVRGFHLWLQTRWPGHSGRVRYAHTLFNLYVVRFLALLTMRLWDAGPGSAADGAGDRLSQVQLLLDRLWEGAPADQPVLVRDVRWLIPVAQSPTTHELGGYFEVARRVAEDLSEEDGIAVQNAAVRMAGGHLRSQLRHVSVQTGRSLEESSLVLSTRRSNALDIALLVQGLVPLLDAFERARRNGDSRQSRELAFAICQGISPDPELFVNRGDLLGPYSMIEHLFIAGDGAIVYTPMGLRHVQLLQEYKARIRRLSPQLYEDCRHFKPVEGFYSPFGVLYGHSSNLVEHMAFKTTQPDAVLAFSLEDVFAGGEADKLAWVSGWRKLPHIKPEVAKLFEYPQQFAEDVFARIEHALQRQAFGAAEARAGRLFVAPGEDQSADSMASIPDLPPGYIRSSDRRMAAAYRAEGQDQAQLLHERLEGEFLVSYKTPGGWAAITKDILTAVLGMGRDVKVSGLPDSAIGVLRLMCPDLVAVQDSSPIH